MKCHRIINGLLAGALALPLAGFANADDTVDKVETKIERAAENTKTFVENSVITAKIKAQLARENLSSATDLEVDTDAAGSVWIHGVAESDAEAARAVAVARGTEGVTAVKSDIIVKRKP